MRDNREGDYLKRLPPEYYRGQAYVHWSLSIEDRKADWLTPLLHSQFRELLTHTTIRYALCCPAYCLMPDHIHLIWIGILDGSDQRNAMKFFRKHLNAVLAFSQTILQQQAYDHVMRETERQVTVFENVVEYICRNPERKQLVSPDGYASYPYTGCLVPGYPNLSPFQDGYWELFWRLYSQFRTQGLCLAVQVSRPQ